MDKTYSRDCEPRLTGIGLRWNLGTVSRLARSGRVYHVPRVRKADSISATMGFDYCPCPLITSTVATPISGDKEILPRWPHSRETRYAPRPRSKSVRSRPHQVHMQP